MGRQSRPLPEPNQRSDGNGREEDSFKNAFWKHRCLIPASNDYEWTRQKGKRVQYYIGVEDEDIFAMSGICELWSENRSEI